MPYFQCMSPIRSSEKSMFKFQSMFKFWSIATFCRLRSLSYKKAIVTFWKKHKNTYDWGILNAGAPQQKLSVPHETFQPKPFNSFEDGKKPHVLKASTKFQIHLKRAPRAWVKKACDFKSRTIPSRPLLGYHGLGIRPTEISQFSTNCLGQAFFTSVWSLGEDQNSESLSFYFLEFWDFTLSFEFFLEF